ncbi:hypothetical protein CcaCcLH18_07883 [Colletotrichum camelliae]|nr:hypothetical protein CcaCcLH18_07883 [Colletotrichum camelliae]
MQSQPEIGHLHQAIESLRAETKTANENTTRETRIIRIFMQQNTAELKENTNTTRAAIGTAKEVWKASELVVNVVKDIKALEPMSQGSTAQSYASVAARGGLAGSMYNSLSQKACQLQILREIIVDIRDPITIASIRAMNPRSLKAHFAEDWENHIGNGAAVRIPTHGVLAHGIRTSSMNMDRFTEIGDDLADRFGHQEDGIIIGSGRTFEGRRRKQTH